MPKVVGGLMAIFALAASMFAGVGPMDCLLRGVVAFITGSLLTQFWYIYFTIRVQKGEQVKQASSSERTEDRAA